LWLHVEADAGRAEQLLDGDLPARVAGCNDDPNAMMAMGNRMGKPGVLVFRGWGSNPAGLGGAGADADIRDDIEALRKKLEDRYPFIHGVRMPRSRRIFN
jgi:hypothetical protein